MSQVKFGASQLKNPTPTKWSNGIQVFTVIGAVILAWVGTATFIPLETASIIQSILGLLIGICNGLKPFLGIETSQKDIPIEEVGEMNVQKKL
jgi:hypothetical protein